MNPILMKILEWLVPMLAPILVAAIKSGAAGVWDKVPAWLRPLISAILGAAAGVALDPADSMAVSGLIGAGLGALGRAGRDAAKAA